ncbi:sedoheptulokinase isoform X1 [Conger conger]|uniref:sedoheptulokinase isoform X1 n=1 Tax=Conger conger TaxID=82655 RepID=UPI002A59C691|nr:sedoheptulokinase isoform X1 [Conger conger]XP_061104764.1 sedoheptulokinase isoform X1 [Conger conger]
MALSSSSYKYVLGMDFGTTSIKVVLIDTQSKEITDSYTLPTKADSSNTVEHAKEQDPERIIDTLNQCIAALPRDKLQNVTKIGVSGQMHGVMFWKAGTGCSWGTRDAVHMFWPSETSQLMTWQDGRCSSDFLSTLPQPNSHLSVATGFGCATIFWHLRHRPEFLAEFTSAGTIHDYVVAMLCGLDKCLMSTQNAASWGYFNTRSHQWNLDILEDSGFPVHLLPDPVQSGCYAGLSCAEWHGIPLQTPVAAALGDFQCSVYSCMTDRTSAVLNVSTSAQLTYAMPAGFEPPTTPDPSSPVSYFPYFDGTYLAVAASLNGGNVMATFVEMLTSWMKELGTDVDDSTIYSRLIKAALDQESSDLTVSPTIFGERHNTSSLGQVCNISVSNISVGQVTRALCRGIMDNLASMLPPEALLESGVTQIMGSGSALSRNEVLRQEAERAFPLPVLFGKDVDSAVGAAMIVIDRS